MKRLIAYVVGATLLVVFVSVPFLAWNIDGEEVGESTSISSYVADFELSASGTLHVSETLDVYVPGFDKHGIFRFFDRVDQSAPGTRRLPRDITVTRDGQDEPFEVLEEQHGRFENVKIGSASTSLSPGVHTYVIEYTMDDAIESGTDGEPSQFYWNLIPSGWRQPISTAELTVHLPVAAPGAVTCGVGNGDDTTSCPVTGTGTDTLVVSVSDLDPNTAVTLKTGLDVPTPAIEDEVPWAGRWDRILGTSPLLLAMVVILALVAGALGVFLGSRSRERPPGFPLQYAPPDGVGPAQAAYILTERVKRETYVATLMHAAQRGAIALDRTDDSWTITDKGGAQGWQGLDTVTTNVAHLLSGPGTSFTATKKNVEAGKRLRTEIADFTSGVEDWAKSSGFMTNSALGPFGGLLVLGAAVLTGVNVFWNPLDMTSLSLIPGAFAVGALSLLIPGAATMRTATGRELWSRIGGFQRVLSTPSSKDRFDFSGRRELYTQYVPWAVAFGCAAEWAQKYRTEVGAEPPSPSYFPAYVGLHTVDHVSSMVNDFDSTVDSAISAYSATLSSSSGGGGGFSGGGGGGGGGGGSW